MNDDDLQQKWDARYADGADAPAPLVLLAENAHLLPARGDALDLASGLGANALYLARRGLRTAAWDLSPKAIERLRRAAQGLPLEAAVRDVVAAPPAPAHYDVICIGHFLDRGLCPAIAAALRPGGLLFYQTFTRDRVDRTGPSNPAYLLAENELLHLFAGLVVRVYREEGSVGDPAHGLRNLCQLVAQAPCT